MIIDRFGSSKDHGVSTIRLDGGKHIWNERTGLIEIRKDRVLDFHGASTHDYTVALTPVEVASLLHVMIQGIETPTGNEVLFAMRPHIVDLQRLVATLIPPFNATDRQSPTSRASITEE